MAPKVAKEKKAKPKKGEIKQATVSFEGGLYNGRKLDVMYPSPQWLVLSMGTELYERMDPPGVVEATYRFTEDWTQYRIFLKELPPI
jgi:hypothetical protein